MSMAQTRGIPEKNIGVRVDYSEYPYKIGVFDHHLLSDEVKNANSNVRRSLLHSDSDFPYHPMVANEAYRRTKEGHRCVMLIVIHSDDRQLPSLAYLDDASAPSFPLERLLEDAVIDNQTVESHYTDELGNRLSPRKHDTLGKAIQLAQARLRRDSELFWKNAEYDNIVEEVLGL